MSSRILRVCQFGNQLQPYKAAFELQKKLFQQRKAGDVEDTLLQLQHPPVYTIGKRGKEDQFRVPPQELEAQGFGIHKIDRGGEVTYHGPGQLILYPIVNLRSLKVGARAFVEGLEEIIIKAVGVYGISAQGQVPGRTGVWIGDRKIAAIGVRISHGLTIHGVSLNVNPNLQHYKNIIPCGIEDKGVTSLEQELGSAQNLQRTQDVLLSAFRIHFNYDVVKMVTPEDVVK